MRATGWFADGRRAVSLDSMRAMVGRRDEGERGLLLEALLEAVDAELCNGGKPPHECFLSIRSDQKGMVPEIHTTITVRDSP